MLLLERLQTQKTPALPVKGMRRLKGLERCSGRGSALLIRSFTYPDGRCCALRCSFFEIFFLQGKGFTGRTFAASGAEERNPEPSLVSADFGPGRLNPSATRAAPSAVRGGATPSQSGTRRVMCLLGHAGLTGCGQRICGGTTSPERTSGRFQRFGRPQAAKRIYRVG
jgi:hypothetical protein